MREKIVMVFLILCALVDEFIQFTWPADFTYTHISIVPHLYFCAFLFLIYKKDSLDRTLIAAFFGILADFFMTSTFPMYAILYAVLGFCSGIFKDRIIKRFRWSCVMVWILLFFLDGIPFMIYSLFQKISVSFSTWFLYMELPTLIFHIVILIGLVYIIPILERFIDIRQTRKNVQKRKQYRVIPK